MFGRYRTVKLKVPRPCCPWCQVRDDIMEGQIQALEERVAHLEKHLVSERSTSQLTLKLGLLLQLSEQGINRPEPT